MIVKHLDLETLKDALYVTSPTGLRQLTMHLEQRGVEFTAQTLQQHLAELLGKSKVVHRQIVIGGEAVSLYALPGLGLG